MIISIDKNHPIFNSDDYKKDIVPFQLMELIKQFPMLLVTNEKDFIVGMTSPKMPIWVWTADNIEETSKNELCEYFYKQFNEYKDFKFVAKPERDAGTVLLSLYLLMNTEGWFCCVINSCEAHCTSSLLPFTYYLKKTAIRRLFLWFHLVFVCLGGLL